MVTQPRNDGSSNPEADQTYTSELSGALTPNRSNLNEGQPNFYSTGDPNTQNYSQPSHYPNQDFDTGHNQHVYSLAHSGGHGSGELEPGAHQEIYYNAGYERNEQESTYGQTSFSRDIVGQHLFPNKRGDQDIFHTGGLETDQNMGYYAGHEDAQKTSSDELSSRDLVVGQGDYPHDLAHEQGTSGISHDSLPGNVASQGNYIYEPANEQVPENRYQFTLTSAELGPAFPKHIHRGGSIRESGMHRKFGHDVSYAAQRDHQNADNYIFNEMLPASWHQAPPALKQPKAPPAPKQSSVPDRTKEKYNTYTRLPMNKKLRALQADMDAGAGMTQQQGMGQSRSEASGSKPSAVFLSHNIDSILPQATRYYLVSSGFRGPTMGAGPLHTALSDQVAIEAYAKALHTEPNMSNLSRTPTAESTLKIIGRAGNIRRRTSMQIQTHFDRYYPLKPSQHLRIVPGSINEAVFIIGLIDEYTDGLNFCSLEMSNPGAYDFMNHPGICNGLNRLIWTDSELGKANPVEFSRGTHIYYYTLYIAGVAHRFACKRAEILGQRLPSFETAGPFFEAYTAALDHFRAIWDNPTALHKMLAHLKSVAADASINRLSYELKDNYPQTVIDPRKEKYEAEYMRRVPDYKADFLIPG